MKNLTINLNTIHGNFDFIISSIVESSALKLESDCFYDSFKLECFNDDIRNNYLTEIYQFETNIHLFDYPYKLNFDSIESVDLDVFEELVDFLLKEYN